MSNIYIQEPPTQGKVLLHTTVGDIDIELWSKETPKASRNFIQLCLEGYYDGTVFHRLVKGFIVQGGDPTGTGLGGKSIYGKLFKDEFHSRLRFVRRGLVAMANSGKDDNGSQFFFTLGASPELQNKHTIFGKVTGNTLYNMLKLEDALVDHNEKPLYPHKIINTKVLFNPFPDIIPRILKKEEKTEKEDKKALAKGTKNFKLLSFGEEAEEEEAEVDAVAKGFRGKSKSSHDLTNDPKLSSVPAIELPEDEETVTPAPISKYQQQELLERVRKKFRRDSSPPAPAPQKDPPKKAEHLKLVEEDDNEETKEISKKDQERQDIRNEIKKIQRELKGGSSQKEVQEQEESSDKGKNEENNLLNEFYEQAQKYQEIKKKQLKKGSGREEQTLAMLAKFHSKMQSAKDKIESEVAQSQPEVNKSRQQTMDYDDEEDEDLSDETWLAHTLRFEEQGPVVAKDANIKVVDRYDISDPRNPINERKRESSKHSMKGKK